MLDPIRYPIAVLVIFLGATASSAAAPPVGAAPPRSTRTAPLEVVEIQATIPKTGLSAEPGAAPASVSTIRYSEEQLRNIRDYSELMRPVLGVAANGFDQGGVGYGFTLRGWSERSNGAQVAYFVDGVPVNMTGHVSANGYGDLYPLVPELVERLVLTRGPFDVRAGPFALAGSAHFTTVDAPTSGLALGGGSFDLARGFAVFRFGDQEAVHGYASVQGSQIAGYRDNSEFDQLNTFNKLTFPLLRGKASVRLQAYDSDFGAPGYLDRPRVQAGSLSSRAAVNPTDGGDSALRTLAFNYRQDGDEPLQVVAYGVDYDFNRYDTRSSTVPVNPAAPGQFRTHDERQVFGASIDKYLQWRRPAGASAGLRIGVGTRSDRVDSEQFRSVQRQSGATTADLDFTVANSFAYAQADLKPLAWVKATLGLRYDYLDFDIDDKANNLQVSPTLSVPQSRFGLSVSAMDGLDLFANYGESFRPPTPIGDQFPRDPTLREATLRSREFGLQYLSGDGRLQALASAFRTTFTNELQGQPAPSPPISLGPSRRDGYDLEIRGLALRSAGQALWLFANYSHIDSELVGRTTGTHVPDVAEYLAKYGLEWRFESAVHGINFTIAQLIEGPKPLNTTNTLRTQRFSRVSANLSYTNPSWRGFNAYVGLNSYPDRRLDETAFTFGNSVGVSPKPPLTVQGGFFVPF
jgi:outer membrane receptor protein involved in Fe transport